MSQLKLVNMSSPGKNQVNTFIKLKLRLPGETVRPLLLI